MTEKCPICWEEVSEKEMVRKCSHWEKHGICTSCAELYTDSLCPSCRMPLLIQSHHINKCDKRGYCREDGDTGYCWDCYQPV